LPWLKLLHITAVIVWCGALLYLPAAVATAASDGANGQQRIGYQVVRFVYTGVATPAALVAIASGTAIIALQGPWAAWLIAKLTVVGLLALGHGAFGMLILRAERGQHRGVRGACWVIGVTSLAWLATIAWLVLFKPG